MAPRYADDPVLAEMLALIEERDRLVPEEVVERAVDPNNPLHGEFEWNNEIAGHQFRITQARALIRKYRVKIVEPQVDVRRFVSVETHEGRGYVPTLDALENPFLRQQVLDRFLAELRSFEARYKHYAELAGDIGRIRTIIAEREALARDASAG